LFISIHVSLENSCGESIIFASSTEGVCAVELERAAR